MKVFLLSFTLISALVFLALVSAFPIRAQADVLSDNISDNISLVDLLPDIEKIYKEALTLPYQEAGKQIYDEEIAEFYYLLLQRTGLDITPE
ncbi:hypothetical protein ACFLRP_05360 [Bacteroidota bacterium]